ncbi:3-deoxy-manno-octulosonate cytidylyltransferase [Vibrio sp. D431a]|uniref:3-deoxy-manno-octulosonate cytidylyltransferase n=1 Tax=Vibrio sp. D431a TaxID=2837388 RepID=UPI0025552714|nr:3-deoxy-manno-octulosonate cytidylyltransferase [Vibrio sp. D431a]MDK9790725.1 3-deoxy-manno-octulosonate cytidylyltransferase [Vibrio sp. D431a]
MKKVIVIPARYGSSRLEGKPLLPIDGIPMVVRVAQQAIKATGNNARVVVATDDIRIAEVCKDYAIDSIMTSKEHESGTDRVIEVYETLSKNKFVGESDLVINVQGDEPQIPVEFLKNFIEYCESTDADMYTSATRVCNKESLVNPNVVKVVIRKDGRALYFSRAPICLGRKSLDELIMNNAHLRHIGIYAYRGHFLKGWKQYGASILEESETLEQLRALEYGAEIKVQVVDSAPPHGVDTYDDYIRVCDDFERMRKLCS